MKAKYIYMNIIAPTFNLFPIIIGIVKYKFFNKEVKMFYFYLIINALVSLAASVLAYKHLPNTPLFHVATIIETVILLYFFSLIFYKNYLLKYLKLLMLLFPLFGFVNSMYFQHIYEFNSYMLSLQSIIIIALCFLYWWYNENDAAKPWSAFPLNWIISGLLLYFSSAFILFTFSNAILPVSSKSVLILLWNIHATLTIFMYILISIGFSKYQP